MSQKEGSTKLDLFWRYHGVSTPFNPKERTVVFVNDVMTDEIFSALSDTKDCLLILNEADTARSSGLMTQHCIIYSPSPRYKYAKIVEELIALGYIVRPPLDIHPTAKINPTAVIGGEGCLIAHSPGLPPVRVPHLGGVRIGKNVDIGALVTVDAGLIDPTIIEDDVKMDNHVHVGHNCHIEREVIITAGVVLGGSCHVGPRVFLGINCATKQKTKIGADAIVGMGAVVTHDVAEGVTVAGNPARKLPNASRGDNS